MATRSKTRKSKSKRSRGTASSRLTESKCLVLGVNNPDHPFGRYVVCLTDNQKKVLFRNQKPKQLGCGVFACAFVGPKAGTIVKLTRDPEDVAGLLAAQPTGHVPKVTHVFELTQKGYALTDATKTPETPVYALVIERLKTFSREREIKLNKSFLRVHKAIEDSGFPRNREEVAAVVDFALRASGDRQVVEDALNIAVDLRKRGIGWSDVHAGNVAYDKKGRLKAIDLGLSQTKLRQRPEILAGQFAGAVQRARKYIRRR